MVVLLAALSACGGSGYTIHHGKVLAHHHDDAYRTLRMQCYAYGSNGACTVSMPVFDEHSEVWWLAVSDCLEDQHDGCHVQRVDVDSTTWSLLHDGQVYDDGTGRSNA